MVVEISNRARLSIDERFVRRMAMRACAHLFPRRLGGNISITFVGQRTIRSLNRRYRGKDTPTNVLAFSYWRNPKHEIRSSKQILNPKHEILNDSRGARDVWNIGNSNLGIVSNFDIRISDLLVGEVLIAPAIVRSEARRYHIPFRQWLLRLLVHGLTHLAGYDHRTRRERGRMERVEEQILSRNRISYDSQ